MNQIFVLRSVASAYLGSLMRAPFIIIGLVVFSSVRWPRMFSFAVLICVMMTAAGGAILSAAIASVLSAVVHKIALNSVVLSCVCLIGFTLLFCVKLSLIRLQSFAIKNSFVVGCVSVYGVFTNKKSSENKYEFS